MMERDEHRLLAQQDASELQWDVIMHTFLLYLPAAGREALALDPSPWQPVGQAMPPYHDGSRRYAGEARDALNAMRGRSWRAEVEHGSPVPLELSGCAESAKDREMQGA